MKPEQQRIAIAEACGWKWYASPRNYSDRVCFLAPKCETLLTLPNPFIEGKDECPVATDLRQQKLPDYLNDLNAMHEAEKVLTKGQFQIYLDWLDVSCGGELELSAMIDGPALGFGLIHATAAQRAEAFLRTLNLWTTL